MNYKIWFVSCSILFFTHSIQANANLTANQQELYLKFNQLMQAEPSPATFNLAQNILTELQQYPLYPYAHFQLLNLQAKQDQLNTEEITAFSQQYPDLPRYFVTTLSNSWFNTQVQKQNWQAIVDNASLLENVLANRCILLQAQQYIDGKPHSLSSEQQNEIQQLWLTGQMLPKHCDHLINLWYQQAKPNLELIYQRALLAFQSQNSALLAELLVLANNDPWLLELANLLQKPQNLPLFIEQAENNELNKNIILSAFPAFVKTITEGSLNGKNPFALYQSWTEKYQLNQSQQNQWKSQLVWHIFDTEIVPLQKWRDQQIQQLKEDRQTERRIRLAIRQQQDLTLWLDLLSQTSKQKQEWQYWQAQNLFKQGKTHESERILNGLSQQRGFYPMLACADLGIHYQPPIEQLASIVNNERSVLSDFIPVLERIQTLYQLGQRNYQQQINREWWALLAKADFSQKLLLSDYANQQQWYDLAVEATIQAKAWGYLALRLPNAYLNWFDLQLKNITNIHRTFAMAIARQESAWKPYAESHANARGLMQLLPTTAQATAEKYQLPYSRTSQLFDPFYNIMLGTAHLQELEERFGNNRILIAAAYNAGSSRVDNWLERSAGKLTMAEFIATIPFYETRNYVQNVLTYDYYYQILQQKPLIKFSKSEYDRLY